MKNFLAKFVYSAFGDIFWQLVLAAGTALSVFQIEGHPWVRIFVGPIIAGIGGALLNLAKRHREVLQGKRDSVDGPIVGAMLLALGLCAAPASAVTLDSLQVEDVRFQGRSLSVAVTGRIVGPGTFNGNPGWAMRFSLRNDANAPTFEYLVKLDRTCNGSDRVGVYVRGIRTGDAALLPNPGSVYVPGDAWRSFRLALPWSSVPGGKPNVTAMDWDLRWNDFSPLIPGTDACRELGASIRRGRLIFGGP